MSLFCEICLNDCTENDNCCISERKHYLCSTCYQDWTQICNQLRKDFICPTCQVVIRPYENNHSHTEDIEQSIYDTSSDYDTSIDYEYNDQEETHITSEDTSEFYRDFYDLEKTRLCFYVPKINNKWNGIATTYYMNGNIMRIVNYTNNRRNGFYKEYDENGNLHHIQYYVNGERNGFSKYFQGALYGNHFYINDILYDDFQQVLNTIQTFNKIE